MLQEQQAQLQQMIHGLGETLKVITTKMEDQGAVARKAFADQKLLIDNLVETTRILREKATEPPFTGAYCHTKQPGVYRCAACGQPLFDAATKYESGSGWPSFYQPIVQQSVATTEDSSHFMQRTEVLCSRCGRINRKLPAPPFRNAQGQLIYEKVCADCWREWIGMGTKVINELRLPLSDPQAQKVFDQHMYEFLNLKPA